MVYGHSSTVDHRPAHLRLLDATTSQDLQQVVLRHLHWAHAFVVVYDVTNRASFTYARHLLQAIHYHSSSTSPISQPHFLSRLDVLSPNSSQSPASPPPLSFVSPPSSPFCGIKGNFSDSSTSQDSSTPSSTTHSSHEHHSYLHEGGDDKLIGFDSHTQPQYETKCHQRSFTPREALHYTYNSSRHQHCLSKPQQPGQHLKQQNSREVMEIEASMYGFHMNAHHHHTLGQGKGQERDQKQQHNGSSAGYVRSPDDENILTRPHLHHNNAPHLHMHTPQHHKHSLNSSNHSPSTSHLTSHSSDTLHLTSSYPQDQASQRLSSHTKHTFTYSQQTHHQQYICDNNYSGNISNNLTFSLHGLSSKTHCDDNVVASRRQNSLQCGVSSKVREGYYHHDHYSTTPSLAHLEYHHHNIHYPKSPPHQEYHHWHHNHHHHHHPESPPHEDCYHCSIQGSPDDNHLTCPRGDLRGDCAISDWRRPAAATGPARRYTTLLLANKRDLEHCRVVWTDEGEALSLQYSCQFYEVSAAESLLGVHLAFHSLLKEARAQQYISSLPHSPVTRTSSSKGVVSSAVSKVIGNFFTKAGKSSGKNRQSNSI